jgi:hypothetical protein
MRLRRPGRIGRYPIEQRRTIQAKQPFRFDSVIWQASALEHSIRAPGVGHRLSVGRTVLSYAPDVAAILDQKTVLGGVSLYIGDGASIARPPQRRRGKHVIGHASIRAQLEWCKLEGVTRAVFTHCGSQIVGANGRSVAAPDSTPRARTQGRCQHRIRRPDSGRPVTPGKPTAFDPHQC